MVLFANFVWFWIDDRKMLKTQIIDVSFGCLFQQFDDALEDWWVQNAFLYKLFKHEKYNKNPSENTNLCWS